MLSLDVKLHPIGLKLISFSRWYIPCKGNRGLDVPGHLTNNHGPGTIPTRRLVLNELCGVPVIRDLKKDSSHGRFLTSKREFTR